MKSSPQIIFSFLCLLMSILLAIFIGCHHKENKENKSIELTNEKTYEMGFNDALDSFILLNLELSMKGEKRSFGEMAEICRERNNIKRP